MRSKPDPEREGNPSFSGRRASTVQSTWVALSLECTRFNISALLICSQWRCKHLQEQPIRAFFRIYLLTNNLLDHYIFTLSETHLPIYRTKDHNRPPDDENATAVNHPLLRRRLETPRPHRANHPHRPRHRPLHRPRDNPEPARDKIQHRRYHHGTSTFLLPGNTTLNACGTLHLEPRDLTSKQGIKSLVVIAYQLLTEHRARFRKWASTKANAILNSVEIVFWLAVLVVTGMGIGRASGAAAALSALTLILAIALE